MYYHRGNTNVFQPIILLNFFQMIPKKPSNCLRYEKSGKSALCEVYCPESQIMSGTKTGPTVAPGKGTMVGPGAGKF